MSQMSMAVEAGIQAGDASMSAAGRSEWSQEDLDAAKKAFAESTGWPELVHEAQAEEAMRCMFRYLNPNARAVCS